MPNTKKVQADYDPLDGDFFPSTSQATELVAPETQLPESVTTPTDLFVAPPAPVAATASRKRGRPPKNPKPATEQATGKSNDFEPIKMLLNYTGSRVVVLTPTIAQHMLKYCNTLNRKLNKKWVTCLAESIKRGEWQLNGEAIIFSKELRLIDGQHRLQAIVLSGKEVESYITTGIDEQNFVSIDTGHARSGSHVLGIGGKVKHSFDLAATLNKLSRYKQKNYDFDGANVISNRQLVSLMEKYKDISKSVDFARKFVKGYSKSSIALCHYVLHKIDRELCDTLFTNLASPTPSIPLVAALRKGTLKEGRSRGRIKQTVVIGSIFNTWIAMRTNDVNSSAIITASEEFPHPR